MKHKVEEVKPYNATQEKSSQVEAMFNRLAPTYDRLNHTLAVNVDRSWRKRAVRTLLPYAPQRVLDLATGTGDFAICLQKTLHPAELVGADRAEEMMKIAREKAAAQGCGSIRFEREDCEQLSYPDDRFDAVTVSFGVRNFENLERGLAQMLRVLSPGGRLVILELSTPQHFPMRQLFRLYSRFYMSAVGRLISKDKQAYSYLGDSIAAFPQGEEMQQILQRVGFKQVKFKRLTLGVCTLYTATK